MGESKNESGLLVFILPFLAVVPALYMLEWESHEASILIVAIPFMTFPVILIAGQIYNGTEYWKDKLKEGGILALGALGASLSASLWLVYDYVDSLPDFYDQQSITQWLEWVSFDLLQSDYTLTSGTKILGMGVWIDSITLMILFVATFLCFLICWFSLGYMNTDPINEDRNHRFYGEFVLFALGMFGMVLADNFLWLFIFWEVMGLCSYLLIGFYYWKDSAAYASKKAFLTTRAVSYTHLTLPTICSV